MTQLENSYRALQSKGQELQKEFQEAQKDVLKTAGLDPTKNHVEVSSTGDVTIVSNPPEKK